MGFKKMGDGRRAKMRLVKVSAPVGKGAQIAQLALDAGVESVSVHQVFVHGPDERHDVVDIQTSTPLAHTFVDALFAAPFYDASTFSLNVREPRTIVGKESIARITWPMPVPTIDVLEDLWQFTHITPSLVVRVSVAAALLATGMIRDELLLVAAGLLFLPLLPGLMAVAFGLRSPDLPLARQGGLMLGVATALLVLAGAIVALLTGQPLAFHQFGTPLTGAVLSLIIGVAATAGIVDDTGRRELIGLAAASQMALVPVWVGICLVQGFPSWDVASERMWTYLLNGGIIVLATVASDFFFHPRQAPAHVTPMPHREEPALDKAS
jgi:hypothetical protein